MDILSSSSSPTTLDELMEHKRHIIQCTQSNRAQTQSLSEKSREILKSMDFLFHIHLSREGSFTSPLFLCPLYPPAHQKSSPSSILGTVKCDGVAYSYGTFQSPLSFCVNLSVFFISFSANYKWICHCRERSKRLFRFNGPLPSHGS